MTPLDLFMAEVPTPAGNIVVAVDADDALRALYFAGHDSRMRPYLARHYGPEGTGFRLIDRALPERITTALGAYVAGDLAAIDTLAVETGGSDFQREVWRTLRTIPAGMTISYGELAAQIGNPAAVRAVGLANGANPVSIVVPCHRVIGANGSLTGYGGGLAAKRWLLAHESAQRGLF